MTVAGLGVVCFSASKVVGQYCLIVKDSSPPYFPVCNRAVLLAPREEECEQMSMSFRTVENAVVL